jgi:hypothetical protein
VASKGLLYPLEVSSLVPIEIGVTACGIFLANGKLKVLPVFIFREVRGGRDGEKNKDS